MGARPTPQPFRPEATEAGMPSVRLQNAHHLDQRPGYTIQAQDQRLLDLASLDHIGQRRRGGPTPRPRADRQQTHGRPSMVSIGGRSDQTPTGNGRQCRRCRLHDRIPVILMQPAWSAWLGEAEGDPAALLRPAPEGTLRVLAGEPEGQHSPEQPTDLLEQVADTPRWEMREVAAIGGKRPFIAAAPRGPLRKMGLSRRSRRYPKMDGFGHGRHRHGNPGCKSAFYG